MKQYSTRVNSWRTDFMKLACLLITAAATLFVVPQAASAQPALGCTSSIDSQIMFKEDAALSVTLANTGTAVGFIPGVAVPLPEGFTITGVTSNALGATVESENLDGSGNGSHPFTGRPVTGPASGKYFFVRPGISSLAPSADPIQLTITINTTDDVELKTPISVDAECQFEFGTNALGTDAPIVLVDPFTTEVVILKVAYVVKGKEGAPATPTGPSWLVIWTATVNIAEDITINSFNLDHEVTDNFLVTGVNVLSGPVTTGSPSGIPGGTIASTVGSVTGTSSSNEIQVEFAGYAPEFRADGTTPVLDSLTGVKSSALGEIRVTSIDVGTPGIADCPDDSLSVPLGLASFTLSEALSGASFLPTDNVTSTLKACASDYFSFTGAKVVSTVPDGTNYLSSSPSAGVTDLGSTVETVFGDVAAGSISTVAHTYTIVETYPSSGLPVNGGDSFNFEHTLSGTVDTFGGALVTDTESTIADPTLVITKPSTMKSIVSVNGGPFTGQPINPGDKVRFRVTTTFESGDQASHEMVDFLPVPKFDAMEHGAAPAIGAPASVSPIRFGPNHTVPFPSGVTFSTAASGADNSIAFVASGPFTVPTASAPVTFEVELEYTYLDNPIANNFAIVNFVQTTTGATSTTISGSSGGSIVSGEPELHLSHGFIDAFDEDNNPITGVFCGSRGPTLPTTSVTPALDADICVDSAATPDAGDRLQTRFIIENKGDYPAYNVALEDVFRATHFFGTPSSFTVVDGDGDSKTFTGSVNASGFSIVLTDPVPPDDGSNGDHIIVITYDVVLDDAIDARHTNVSDAEIIFYSNAPGGTGAADNYVPLYPGFSSASAQARSRDFVITKGLSSGANSSLAIQDTTTYEVTWAIPEGTHGALKLRDTLPTGLAFISGTAPTITTSASFATDVATANAVSGVFSNDDRRFEIDLGDTTNANRDSSATETVTAVYDVVLLNVSANTRGAQPRNTASAISTGRTKTVGRRLVTVIEPQLEVTVTPTSTELRPGDTVTFNVSIPHLATSGSDAHDTTFSLDLPSGLTNLVVTNGPSVAPAASTVTSTSIAYDWTNHPVGNPPITFTFTAEVESSVAPISTLIPRGDITWTSQAGSPTVSTTNTAATERTGADGGGGLDGYADSDTPSIQVNECLTVADCGDANICTVDSCPSGLCVYTPVAAGGGCIGGGGVCSGSGGIPANSCEACIDNQAGGSTDAGCIAGAPVCDTTSGPGMHFCVPCLDTATGAGVDDGCSASSPVCAGSGVAASCFECTVDAHCAGGEKCFANSCVPFFCGDGAVDPGETCDDGGSNGEFPANCSSACLLNRGAGPCADTADCQGTNVVCNASSVCAQDSDRDGIQDVSDPDDDNDGIPDTTESGGVDSSQDEDGDFIPDYMDPDAPEFVDGNDDGVDDRYDFDGDGVPNHLDFDADNDGLTDAYEGGGTDDDGDGVIDDCVDTAPFNGVCDSVDASALPVPNTDTTEGPDFLDLDADGDGITDASESGATDDGDGIPDDYVDADGDGLNNNGATTSPTDTDGVDAPDHLSLDSDGDTVADDIEGHDIDMNGVADVTPVDVDTDGDGIDDAFDPDCSEASPCESVIGTPAPTQDTDADGVVDYRDLDSDADGIPDATECGTMGPPMCLDSDQDAIPDYLEVDSDDDGVPDHTEGYDSDLDGTADFARPPPADRDEDGDGIDDAYDADCTSVAPCMGVIGAPPNLPDSDDDEVPDYRDVDDDDDGILTATEAVDGAIHGDDPDNDLIPAYLDLDSDGDTASDMSEGGADPTIDINENGIPDYLDADAVVQDTDMDGVADHLECPAPGNYVAAPSSCPDTDGDGSPDFDDTDDDGDGIETATEIVEDPSEADDADMDGVPSYLDLDSDGDGTPDAIEAGGTDTPPNTDGASDGSDPYDNDSDGDGIPDRTEAHDEDADGVPDVMPSGTDSDGDGLDDAFDPDSGAAPVVPADRDSDGIPDFQDLDADGDGIVDTVECGPQVPNCVDTDSDGTPDYLDLDSDDDGLPDATEGHDANSDGTPDTVPSGNDVDRDGLDDAFDPDQGGTLAPIQDTDADGAPDYQDTDDDGDGIDTATELASSEGAGGTDIDDDGVPNHLDDDADGDGIPDADEPGDDDADGIPDYLDDIDGIGSTVTGGGVAGGAFGCSVRPMAGGAIPLGWLLLVLGLGFVLRRRLRR